MTTAIHPTCKICNHPEVDDVNAKLIAGLSGRVIGEMYGLHYKGILNHKKKHLPKQMVKSAALQDENAADRLLARVEDLYSKALLLIEKADSDGKWTAATGAIKESRQCLELLAKLIGTIKTGTSINIVYNTEFVEARLAIYNALLPFPEAKQAVIAALEEVVEDADYEEVNPAQLGPGEIRS